MAGVGGGGGRSSDLDATPSLVLGHFSGNMIHLFF